MPIARGSRRSALLALALVAAGCRGDTASAPVANDARRQEALIANQADALRRQAENSTSAIEQAMENEGAAVFENRGNLLNESGNAAEAENASR